MPLYQDHTRFNAHGRMQAELQALKEQHGARMFVRKATSSATAPFPITVTVTVLQPTAAAQYDVNSLKVSAPFASSARVATVTPLRSDGTNITLMNTVALADLCSAGCHARQRGQSCTAGYHHRHWHRSARRVFAAPIAAEHCTAAAAGAARWHGSWQRACCGI